MVAASCSSLLHVSQRKIRSPALLVATENNSWVYLVNLQISKDGFLTLGPVLPRWSPMKLPLPKGYSPLIAVYWADMVTWKESLILAEEFLSGWRMEQATTLIRRRFPDFTAKHVVLVNWVYMKMWIRNITKLSMERTVSFEALLTTDMSRSFVVFNYDGPAVTIGEASTYHAQVGFDAGNNKDSFTMRKALTKDINRLLMYDSNIDESGAQLFHTDEEKISYDQEICHNSYKECLDTSDGIEYKGREYQTASGRTCQAWSSQEPHPHEQCKFTDRSNYCSNSIDTACRKAKPWCYTMDPKMAWELCDIPECGGSVWKFDQ
ncbi:putative apolipoprotein(a)-like protein 2 [Lamellibrachia satsuma]|nr:putative apolipoprotein(a)-like protein 2 [Lamellibrachia satsuma]